MSGAKKDLLKFKGFAEDNDYVLSAKKFVPYPKKFQDKDKTGFFKPGGRDWCEKNWGTKWGMYETNLDFKSETKLLYTFLSAWTPPIPIIEKMSKLFPTLEFELKYFEQDLEFKGVFKIKNSKIIIDKESAYHGKRGG
ncbi:MAG: hypothetical protein KKH44_00425 [Bacteroidetes bacterium]|nr:hypothetical protein [Bacteroidota bacterium]